MPTKDHTPTLELGTALVLAGPPGCGKSTLARELAERQGCYAELDIELMGSRFDFASVLRKRPRTIIIEGAPTTERQFSLIKGLLTSTSLTVRGMHNTQIEVPTPHLIICAQDEDLPERITSERRFNVFLMPVVV